MKKILTRSTVIIAMLCAAVTAIGQQRYTQPATGNATFNVDCRVPSGQTNTYTDEGGAGNPYLDNGQNTIATFVPRGRGTAVELDFQSPGSAVNIGTGDRLEIYNNGALVGTVSGMMGGIFQGNATDRNLECRWFEDGSANAPGWESFVNIINTNGDPIPCGYNWEGFAEGGNLSSFIFNPGQNDEAYVFCGFNADVRLVIADSIDANNGTYYGFNETYAPYIQQLQAIEVNWGDATPVQTFNVPDPTANRNAYDAAAPTRITSFGTNNNGVQHTYNARGRYTVTITGIDELGVRSVQSTVQVLIEGDAPTTDVADDVEICIGDPASLERDVDWTVDNYTARVVEEFWRGPDPTNPSDNINDTIELARNQQSASPFVYTVNPSEYPVLNGATSTTYTFCHHIFFDNGCGEQVNCITYTVYKEPDAGSPNPNADNTICETANTFNLNSLIQDQDPGGVWLDDNGASYPNGIIKPDSIANSSGVGTYNFTYVVSNPSCPTDQESVNVTITEKPFAGINDPNNPGRTSSNPVKLCVADQVFDLFSILDGPDPNNGNQPAQPDINGTWYLRQGVNENVVVAPRIVNAQFLDPAQWGVVNPEASRLLELIYEVQDPTGNCNSDRKTVFVRLYSETVLKPASIEFSVCEQDPVVSFNDSIDEAFRTTTAWSQVSGPPSQSTPGFFQPSRETVEGTYVFKKTVRNPDNQGADICSTKDFIVTVNFFLKPEAGADVTRSVCPDGPKNLETFLSSGAELGGTFFGPNDPGTAIAPAVAAAFDFEPFENQTVTFIYRVFGEPGVCPDDESTITINVGDYSDPGQANSIIVCSSDAPFALVDSLLGTPDDGGTWSPGGGNHTRVFNPANEGDNTFTYSFAANGVCPAVSAQLTIDVFTEPNSGNDFQDEICNVDMQFNQYNYDLAAQISGAANGVMFGTQTNAADVMEEFGAIQPVADAVTNASTGMVNVVGLGGGTYDFFYRTHNIGCEADTAFFRITINQVGNAGKDSLFVRCGDEPTVNMRDYIGPMADNFGEWEDVDGTGGLTSLTFNAQFDPSRVVNLNSPDTGFRLIYTVEVDECPTDSANVVAYVSDTLKSGIRKGGTDSLLYACEDETDVLLTDNFIDGSFFEAGGTGLSLNGIWTLVPSGGGSLIPQSVLNEVNSINRTTYFTGPEENVFNIEEFVKFWEGQETFTGSRIYQGGADNEDFWEWLKTDRILNFRYTVRDTSIGKLKLPTYYEGNGPIPRDIQCDSKSSIAQVALMPDYDKRFTLAVDPGQNAKLTVCQSIEDLDMRIFFSELQRDQARLDILDIFNSKFDTLFLAGIPKELQDNGAVYSNGPNDLFRINASLLDTTLPNPTYPQLAYRISLVAESGVDASGNKCGEARTQIPFELEVEKVPNAGGINTGGPERVSEFTICEGSPNFDMSTKLINADPFLPSHTFTAVSANANQKILGKFFSMQATDPGLYTVRYTIPTVACVNPIVTSFADPARNTRPKRFTSLLDITVESGPDLDGFDQQVNVFEVCSQPGVNLGSLFPIPNNIDQSGEFNILTGCGQINFSEDFNNAIYLKEPGVSCSTVLIEYCVEKEGCPKKCLQMRLNITPKPLPGVSARDTFCLDNGPIDMYSILQAGLPSGSTVDRNGTFIGKTARANNAILLGGRFDPTVAGVGTHVVKYTVGDGEICELDSAFATIVIERIQRTGTNGTINACAGTPPLDLFKGLNGFFDRGGIWIGPSGDPVLSYMLGPDSSVFDHQTYRDDLGDQARTQVSFQYVIRSLCAQDTSVVTVFLTPGAVSGPGDTTVFVCEDLPEYDLFDALGIEENGDFARGGIWRGLDGAPQPTVVPNTKARIFPTNINPGTYRYRYTVEAECGDTVLVSSTIVTVDIGDNISAGKDTTIAVCYTGPVNLDNLFQVNGTGEWSTTNPPGGLVDGNIFDLDQTTNPNLGTYSFKYSVPELYNNCGDTFATFTIDIRQKPKAGRDTTAFYCNFSGQEFPALNFFPNRQKFKGVEKLVPDAGIIAGSALSGGVFFPSRLAEGNYSLLLVITDQECGADTAVANIYIYDANNDQSILCGDLDGDGIRNGVDLDVDGDGLSNIVESTVNGVPRDPFGNHDGDALFNFEDPDFAALIGSFIDNGVVVAFDFDRDGIINARDLDSDNDLSPDIIEGFGFGALVDANTDGKTDTQNPQGINNTALGLTNNGSAPVMTTPNVPDYLNRDSDGDGIGDIMEIRDHANYADVTSLVFVKIDTDLDGTIDARDLDSDDDGISDARENQGGSLTVVINTNAFGAPGRVNTDNVPNFRDSDSDGDGISDRLEAYLNNGVPNDFDGDGIPNFLDLDSDNDNISDAIELGTTEIPRNTDNTQLSSFSVRDTLPDFIDFDSDGDGILDAIEAGDIDFGNEPVNTDKDNTGDLIPDALPDYRDLDSDGDRIPDFIEGGNMANVPDTDGDGIFNFRDLDSDNDRYLDIYEAAGDTVFAAGDTLTAFIDFDLDGIVDYLDFDSDDDGINDFYEVVDNGGQISKRPFDADGDGMPDFHDLDSDDDGLLDEQERGEGTEGSLSPPRDSDPQQDGIYDFRAIDADGDGVLDRLEGDGDCDGDGIENYRDNGDNCKIEAFIPEAFSPNGDRINDFFVIPDAQFFPGNSLKVYNRWGGLVFEAENYDNTWDGTNDGEVLPDGTYFYTFDLGLGQEPLTGFIYITSK